MARPSREPPWPRAALLLLLVFSAPALASTHYRELVDLSVELRQTNNQIRSTVDIAQREREELAQRRKDLEASCTTPTPDCDEERSLLDEESLQSQRRLLDGLAQGEALVGASRQRLRQQVARFGRQPAEFKSLLQQHLGDRSGPEKTTLLMEMCTRKLHWQLQQLLGDSVLATLDADLAAIEDTLDLMDDLSSGRSQSLDEASRRLGSEGAVGAPSTGGIDALDRLLP